MNQSKKDKQLLFELVNAGVHLGHRSNAWNPNMKSYIYQKKHNFHIIDVVQTMLLLRKACQFVFNQSRNGHHLLIVGTKNHLTESIIEQATKCEAHWVVNRWLGGLLTNQITIKNRLLTLINLETNQSDTNFTKKEKITQNRKLAKLRKNFDGLRGLNDKPSCAIIIDPVKEKNALAECNRLNIPVIALIDTNGNPSGIDFPIPANDDSILSVQYLLKTLVEASSDGLTIYFANKK